MEVKLYKTHMKVTVVNNVSGILPRTFSPFRNFTSVFPMHHLNFTPGLCGNTDHELSPLKEQMIRAGREGTEIMDERVGRN